MIFAWFNAGEAEQSAQMLAETYARSSHAAESKNARKKARSDDKAMQNLIAGVQLVGRSQKLNIYKKARFGQAFQRTLSEHGFDEAFVRDLTQTILGHL